MSLIVLAAFNATTLLVTHNRHEALRLAQDLVVIVDGRVHAAGDKREVATNPRVTEVAEVLGYSVLIVDERRAGPFGPAGRCRLAVPPGALQLGPVVCGFRSSWKTSWILSNAGRSWAALATCAFTALPATGVTPARGDRVPVHAEGFCRLG